jgi:hypothetical protein
LADHLFFLRLFIIIRHSNGICVGQVSDLFFSRPYLSEPKYIYYWNEKPTTPTAQCPYGPDFGLRPPGPPKQFAIFLQTCVGLVKIYRCGGSPIFDIFCTNLRGTLQFSNSLRDMLQLIESPGKQHYKLHVA